MQGLVV